jgi:LmbE family N-acetylglucosaminyl deacetylase
MSGASPVLVFAPHPDDDVIGCGGSIAKHVDAGRGVAIVYLTSGEAGSLAHGRAALAAIREAEARAAAGALGVADLVFLRHPDGGLEAGPALVAELVRLLRARRPGLVYLPHGGDGGSDHQAASRAVSRGGDRPRRGSVVPRARRRAVAGAGRARLRGLDAARARRLCRGD